MKQCEKCDKWEQEYGSPGEWCRFCWASWWVGDYPRKELKRCRTNLLRRIRYKYGPAKRITK